MKSLNRPLKNVGEAAEARQKQAKKRSLHAVNEHFEPVFNAVSATQVVFQRPVNRFSLALRLTLLASALLLTPGVVTWAQEAPVSTSLVSIPADSLYGLPVALTDASGVAFDWREMAGKPLLVTMFYGDCASACPVLMESLQRTIAELKPKPGTLKVLMVSLNPQHDTPTSLMHLMHMHKIDAGVFRLAVAADEGQTRAMAAALQIKYRQLDNGEITHNTRVSLLNAEGQLIASSTLLKSRADPALLAELRKAL